MKNIERRLTKAESDFLGIKFSIQKGSGNPRYTISVTQWATIQDQRSANIVAKPVAKPKLKSIKVGVKTTTKTNNYKPKFVLSAWNLKTGQMMDIDKYCSHYSLPRIDIHSYKLVSHTGTPYYNIAFKENILESGVDFDTVLTKYKNFTPSKKEVQKVFKTTADFDMLTYSDVHIGMDTDSTSNAMYAEDWTEKSIKQSYFKMLDATIAAKNSDTIIVDELGDFLDGFNGYTTRGGHKLPQIMTNEEAFDVALKFKIDVVDRLSSVYDKVIINNICNDNHAGSFGYFVNSSLKNLCDRVFENVTVTNHRYFINHYIVNDIAFVITHGKDDSTLKFGFKPQLDSKGLEKIDQYCKQNDLYKKAKKIVFKKGDSHQCLFDMCTSDDFFYFNYPALSPSSQWVQNNFKKGRRGYVLEKWHAESVTIDPFFF